MSASTHFDPVLFQSKVLLQVANQLLFYKVEPNENDSLKYVPGRARSHHLEQMMSKEELEEEQRSVTTPKMAAALSLSEGHH